MSKNTSSFDLDDDFGFEIIEEISNAPAIIDKVSHKLVEIERPTNLSIADSKQNQYHDVNPAKMYVESLQSKLSQATMKSLLDNVAQILGFQNLLNCPWQLLSKDAVEYVIRCLREKGLAPTSINLYLNAMRQTAEHASDFELIDFAELRRIKRIKQERGSRCGHGREVTGDEIKKLLATCKSDDIQSKGFRDSAIICIMRGCGLRRSEVVGLKFSSINELDRTVSVIGKGNKERILRIPKMIYPVLERWMKFRREKLKFTLDEDPLFCRIHKAGTLINAQLTAKGIEVILQSRIKRADIITFSPHDLRRTFCTGLLSKGIEMSDVQKLMGHADMKTTQRYDMRSRDRLLDISDDIEW
ncbi:tyrosine-type recombinase/integrase [Photobacterium damselae]|uniref:tyrosine-type recombinase/integrase n=1 Tax=Photobacterium damselae TaxID=38293 RepID=UPI001EEEBF45|nr:tyrosine-type recombinase/integrase [Photobacterium damselae]UKA04516.1 tyrosine-type recombinase/integrase [Photobacterium damselae subsp. damselae]